MQLLIFSLHILQILPIFLFKSQCLFLFNLLFLFDGFDYYFLSSVLHAFFLCFCVCIYYELVLFFCFVSVFDEGAPHVKFTVADFATEAPRLGVQVGNHIFGLEVWLITVESPMFVHTNFAGS